ncbi:poly-beta-1,6 N-acetyl-D-glucosamine synthase [Chitinophaga dinghuensis]|uniref:Poly-beta-1,6 N-acetyl-D-glucosamine synthase n=1 Tax=Chitinophaga dinghuensis TaxID=1539050 RepID=A0A327VWM1_9BACT|nr:glycosyltransferase [Chitinophaga dinghuensis]RAJ79244.1 poly-beta-1,6 N-acetyl-D-glucosamine synthase [Chitinophaga dinghuensis]
MNDGQQIFQTKSPLRWRTFQWTSRLLLIAVAAMAIIVWIALRDNYTPGLPTLEEYSHNNYKKLSHPVLPHNFTKQDTRTYKGFDDIITDKNRKAGMNAVIDGQQMKTIRAGFYVDWDPQSFYSLQSNIDKMNTVVPEWFFIDPKTDTLRPQIDMNALQLMQDHHVAILPLINNINVDQENGDFDSDILHQVLTNPAKKERLIADIIKYLHQYHLQGINIDFEELKEKSDEPLISFQQELYAKLHQQGLLVTQDVTPGNDDYNLKELNKYNDYIFLMGYDQHFTTSVAGPVSEERWIEKVLDQTANKVPANKIVLCIASYGYDWPAHSEGTTVTYQEALALANRNHAKVIFDEDTYNCHFTYKDDDGVLHQVQFMDAAGNFNTLRFADEYGTAGTAIWRLGSEDARLWRFYYRRLDNQSLKDQPFNFNNLSGIQAATAQPDYIGDGEVLDVVNDPHDGSIKVTPDTDNMVASQEYETLPTGYVIRKSGQVNKQVILTFDDGPDATYTPQVLDILKQEHVPAAFFVVGINAENNLTLLKKIYNSGNEIGNHTFTHPNIAAISPERANTEINATRLLIEAATGHSTILFRAPYNADAEPTTPEELKPVSLSKKNNYYTIGESIDPEDWEPGVSADTIYQRVVSQYEANPDRGIILLHDAGGDRSATVAALPRIIHYFKSKGIGFTTVASLLHKKPTDVMPAVNSSVIAMNGTVALIIFRIQQFLQAAFWLAIILGLIKILSMLIMATIQYFREKKNTLVATAQPGVSIIVPAYNESVNAVNTIKSLLQQRYPEFEIIFVDDGSKDNTYELVKTAFDQHPQVEVLTKPNGGKASALNYGIGYAKYDFVVCIDADTQLYPDAIEQLMRKFITEDTGAVAGNVKVGNETTLLARWQSIEYITAQNFDRRALDLVNGITVVPGAIGAFRKSAIQEAGGFTTDTLAEDCDLTIRILRKGYIVRNCTAAVAMTEAPETLNQFMKQRFRWSYGIMQSCRKNLDACFNPKYKALGMISLPNIVIFQVILPILAPLADIMFVWSLIWNRHDPAGMHKILFFYVFFLVVDLLVAMVAFLFEKAPLKKLIWMIPQKLVYRQLMYVILFRSIKKAIRGNAQGWGVLKRTGNVQVGMNA